jgi:hypothetical protein
MRTRLPLVLGLACLLGGTVPAAHADLFVSSGRSNQVLRYDATTGSPVGSGVFVSEGSAGLSGPSYLIFTSQSVPEPSGLALFGVGTLFLLVYAWRGREKRGQNGKR